MWIAQSRGLAEVAAIAVIIVGKVKEAHLVIAHHLVSKGRKLKFYWLHYLILRNLLRARKIKSINTKAKEA